MKFSELLGSATHLVKENAPEILTALSIGGVITTSYLVGKASFKAAEVIHKHEWEDGNIEPDPKERLKERTKLTWKLYIPGAISGAATIVCIVCSNRTSTNRTTAAVAAYSLTERAFSEYKEKVVETIGANKDQKIRDEIAQDTVNAHPPSKEVLMMVGEDEVLCCELRTNRYFRSTHENIQRAVNEINFQINHENYVSLSEFYTAVGLPITDESVNNGWTFEQLLELDFSTALTDNNRPCLTFRYNYVKPLYNDPGPLRTHDGKPYPTEDD